ncbi:hypothetical protein [Nostoc sp. MG11]|uniref:hypothetical protein n=1 Tax=Nostoc sp. MG11 TaxID=2721166 RepID=UPI0018688E67|nr:hypothetical protein [Nostoc sp. MG11]
MWGSNSDNLKTAFTQLRQVSQNNHKTAFERCPGSTVSHGEHIQGRRGTGYQREKRGWGKIHY